jgi:hypothetical protein
VHRIAVAALAWSAPRVLKRIAPSGVPGSKSTS